MNEKQTQGVCRIEKWVLKHEDIVKRYNSEIYNFLKKNSYLSQTFPCVSFTLPYFVALSFSAMTPLI